jgi:hypothetical protein
VKKTFLMLYLIILITPSFAGDNYGELLKIDGSHNYSFNGYNIHYDSFFVRLKNKHTQKMNFYKFKNNQLHEAEDKENKEYDLIQDHYHSGKKFKERIFPNNKTIKEYCSGGVQYNDNEYIICLQRVYMKQELYMFNGSKFNKLETGDIVPIVGYGNTFLFYDKEYDKLYFTGEKRIPTKIESIDNGLYVYDFKTKKLKLLQKANEGSELAAPFRIPGTEKLIYINDNIYGSEGIHEIYMRDIEK